MINDLHARQLSAETYRGEVDALNRCIEKFNNLTEKWLFEQRDALMVKRDYADQMEAARHHGELCGFNYCVQNYHDVTLEELESLRNAMTKAAELVLEHGVVTVIP
jgi:hypothetical protein